MSEAARSRLIPEVDFNAEGKQTGFIRLFHSVHASAYGFIPIPIVVVKNGEGPTALFVSGNHGDEYEGQVALCNLARTLEPSAIKGRVIILPMANFPAAMAGKRTSPIDEGNLNRTFPGNPDGFFSSTGRYVRESFRSSRPLPKHRHQSEASSGRQTDPKSYRKHRFAPPTEAPHWAWR